VRLVIDSATTAEVRELARSLSLGELPKAQMGCNGPEHWSADTAPLPPAEALRILGNVVAEHQGL
jgi:hypothetical protein